MSIQLQEHVTPEFTVKGKYAVVAITKHGTQLARKIAKLFPDSDLYYMKKHEQGDEEERGITLFEGSVRILLPSLFTHYQGLIVIISLGAVVRMIAPILKDKKTDPAVVVVDDRGEHVISVLSGHLGGANELTREVAALLNAYPVVTTASDVQKTIPVDLFGRRFGWEWESDEKLTPVSASVVNEEKVVVVQESGERNWWMHETAMPANIHLCSAIDEGLMLQPDGALVVTHRLLESQEEAILTNGVLYRPKVIVLGIGCNRGTAAEEIEQVIEETLKELKISKKSVKTVATIDLKKDEVGLLEVVRKHQWEFIYYPPAELNTKTLVQPSDTVYKFTSAYGVSEPAAMLASGNDELLLVKKKSGNVTISVGLISYK